MAKFTSGWKGPGRPKGSRTKLCDAFVKDLAADWQIHGAQTIRVLRVEDPSTYVRIVASLMPKELHADIDTKITDLKTWLSWVTQDTKTIEAMTPKILAAPDPVMAPVKRREPPSPGPICVPWNDSEAREPVVEKPKLRLTPHEPNAND
jgi:hypothetical protein